MWWLVDWNATFKDLPWHYSSSSHYNDLLGYHSLSFPNCCIATYFSFCQNLYLWYTGIRIVLSFSSTCTILLTFNWLPALFPDRLFPLSRNPEPLKQSIYLQLIFLVPPHTQLLLVCCLPFVSFILFVHFPIYLNQQIITLYQYQIQSKIKSSHLPNTDRKNDGLHVQN